MRFLRVKKVELSLILWLLYIGSNSLMAQAISHYNFDTDFQDSSSSANHGTTVLGNISNDPNEVAVGLGALSLNGVNNSDVDLTTPIVFTATDPWSTAFWSKRGSITNNRGMVMGDTSNRRDYIWLNDHATTNGLLFKSSSNASLDFTVVHDLDYHHYALVADGTGNLILYRDGTFQQTVSGDTSFRITSIGNGFDTNTFSLHGEVDDVQIYNSALTASQVSTVYANGTVVTPPSNNSPPGCARVFLLAGQSNMLGFGASSELPPPYNASFPEVRYWNGANWVDLRTGFGRATDFGPEILFGHILAQALPNDTIYLVKHAVSGTSLYEDWAVGTGVRYIDFMGRAAGALANLTANGIDHEVSAMLWLQGESDAAEGQGAAYEKNLRNFIADMRSNFGVNLPFYMGRVRDFYGTPAQATLVRNAQVTIANTTAHCEWFDTDDLNPLVSRGHYNANGQIQIGTRYANLYLDSGPTKTYRSWAIGQGLDGTSGMESGFADDPDSDGMLNGVEWVLGGNPQLNDHGANSPVLANGSTPNNTFTFTRAEDSIGRVNLNFEWSIDLVNWNHSVSIDEYLTGSYPKTNGIVVEVDAALQPDVITVHVPDSLSAGKGLFFRLRASE